MLRSSRMPVWTRLPRVFVRTSFRLLCLGFTERCDVEDAQKATGQRNMEKAVGAKKIPGFESSRTFSGRSVGSRLVHIPRLTEVVPRDG